MEFSNEKLLEGARNLKAKGYTPQQVDSWLQSKGSSLKSINDFASQPEPTHLEKLTKEQKAQIQANIDDYNKKGYIRGAKSVWDFLTGFGEGVDSGTDRVVDSATFGMYGRLNPEVRKKQQMLQERAESVGLGTTNKIAGGMADFGGMAFNPLNGAVKTYQVATNAPKLIKAANFVRNVGVRGAENAVSNALYGLGYSENPYDYIVNGDYIEDAKTGLKVGTALPVAGKAVSFLGKPMSVVLGKTTGAGKEAIETAYDAGTRNSQTFVDNLNGDVPQTSVFGKMKTFLDDLKKKRSENYKNGMPSLEEVPANYTPIKDTYNRVKSDYFYKGVSKASTNTKKVLKEADKAIKEFSENPNTQDLGGLDALKQRIQRITVSETGKEAAEAIRAKTSIANAIKEEITKQSPEYGKVMQEYEDASNALAELEDIFGAKYKQLKSPAKVSRRLQNAFKNSTESAYGNQRKAIDSLQGESRELSDALSGQLLSTWTGKGITPSIGTVLSASAAVSNPITLSAALATSPKLVGKTAYTLGQLKNFKNRTPSQIISRIISEND